ncbi:hypothetical protein GGF39_002518, partial [Coemansia sp. RSA 1721]
MSDENAAFDIISRLPYDLSLMVARKLGTRDLHECSLVSKSWNRVFMDESIVMPLIQQMSHFDQEPIMFQTLPTGHERETAVDETVPSEENSSGNDSKREAEEKERVVENYANQQWLKNRRVLMRVLQKLLNRDRRWRIGQPTTRIYLPPVPIDGTDSDIRSEWQGSVRVLKMKGGIVAALYTEGRILRMWRLDTDYDEVKALTDAYIAKNRAILDAQTKYGGPPLPPFADEDVERLLKISRSGKAQQAVPLAVRLRKPARLFDFFIMSSTLATASADGDVDVYDYRSGQHRHTLRVRGTETIGSLHVWLDYVVAGHGTRITLWNHRTGAVLEDALATAHNAPITGVFVLDNDSHLLSIDASGFMVITDRTAAAPKADTLLDVPLYPMILAGQMGAPYMMRLLHASHLCVWGKYSLGHFELYEPGLGNLPPLSSLLMAPRDGGHDDVDGEPESVAEEPVVAVTQPASEPAAAEMDEPRQVLAQLEATHHDMELMYRSMAGDRGDMFPDGHRIERHRRNQTTAEQRYHVINIDSPFEQPPEGDVVCVDFRRALYLYGSAIEIFDVDKRQNGRPVGVPLGLFPVDPVPGIKLPPAPLKKKNKPSDHDDDDDDGDGESNDDGWSTEESDAAFPGTVEDLEETYGQHGEFAQYLQLLRGLEGAPMRGHDHDHEHDHDHDHEHGHDHHHNPPHGHAFAPEGSAQLEMLSPTDISDASELGLIEAVVMRCIITLRMSMDLPLEVSGAGQLEIKLLEQSRQFLGKYFPEIFAACYARVEPQVLLAAAPFYIQRLHESRFVQPTINVDHRGQKTTAAKLVRDMQRIYRVSGTRAGEQWTGLENFVPLAATQLVYTTAAMDDGRVAVGCSNGYIV